MKKSKPKSKGRKSLLNKTDKRVWDTVKKTVTPIEHDYNEQMQDLLSDFDTDVGQVENNLPVLPLDNVEFQKTIGDIYKKISQSDGNFKPNVHIDYADELEHGDITQMHKTQGKRFLRGQLPIEARLDLHGMTQDIAHDQLNRFIKTAYTRGLRKVIVVTGKGKGILKTQTPRWLNDSELRPYILSFSYAQPRDGGDGALYVLLRKKS